MALEQLKINKQDFKNGVTSALQSEASTRINTSPLMQGIDQL